MASHQWLGSFLLADALATTSWGRIHRALSIHGATFPRHYLLCTFSEELVAAGLASHGFRIQRAAAELGQIRGAGANYLFEADGPVFLVCDYLPGWVTRMKASMRILTPIFSTNRMLTRLAADGCARAKDLADWKARLRAAWDDVKVDAVTGDDGNRRIMGDTLSLDAIVRLDSRQELVDTRVVPLSVSADLGGGVHRYEGGIPCDCVGQRAYSVPVRPDHPDANNVFSTELMTWQ